MWEGKFATLEARICQFEAVGIQVVDDEPDADSAARVVLEEADERVAVVVRGRGDDHVVTTRHRLRPYHR